MCETEKKDDKLRMPGGASYEYEIKRLKEDLKKLRTRYVETEGDLRCLLDFLKLEIVTFKKNRSDSSAISAYTSPPWKYGKKVIKKEYLED